MHNCEVIKRGKKAGGITVELLLAIILAVVVLFFILSLFSDNLKTMVASSRISNMFDNNNKTTYANQAFDPTSVNVQVLAEQGNTLKTLDDYKKAAIEKINHYAASPPANEAEVMDLAMWASIAKTIKDTSGSGGTTTLTSFLPSNLESEFYTQYGIRVQITYNSSYHTTINPTPNNYITTAKVVNFPVGKTIDSGFLNNTDNQFVTVKEIVKQFRSS